MAATIKARKHMVNPGGVTLVPGDRLEFICGGPRVITITDIDYDEGDPMPEDFLAHVVTQEECIAEWRQKSAEASAELCQLRRGNRWQRAWRAWRGWPE